MNLKGLTFPKGTEENHGKLRVASALSQIRNDHLTDTSVEHYRYATLLSVSSPYSM
jgi:hypothetical protein